MTYIRYYITLVLSLIIVSCGSKKDIIYLQDIEPQTVYSNQYEEYKLKVDDILKIEVGAENPETALTFNPRGINPNISVTKESLLYYGYQIDSKGMIDFPELGKINAKGLTVRQIRDIIYNTIIEKGILKNPSVDVKHVNAHFTVLGEVSKPGKYEYIQNNINILEAIGMAGDLTINGKRDDIKLIRDYDGKKSVVSIDLTNKSFLEDYNFQISSGDIIIINPNITKVKNAGIIGNSGTLLSLLSFILSSIIVISN